LLLFAGTQATVRLPTPLMQLAATRGRLMELLARTWRDDALADRAFMTGIMSLMDALLSTPLPQILAHLPVAEDVRLALLERSGRLGALLDVIEVVEARDGRDLGTLLAALAPLTTRTVEEAHAAALAWANSIAM
jgi:EAL and modified HD-GYP domain-containing signal transduction protein